MKFDFGSFVRVMFIVALAMVLFSMPASAGDLNWDLGVEKKLQSHEAKLAQHDTEIAELKSRMTTGTPATTTGATKATVVRKANGQCVCQICDASGCREVDCDCSNITTVGVAAVPCAGCSPSAPFGYTVQSAPVTYYGGGCAGGGCSSMGDEGGGCAGGGCSSSSGRRGGLFRRRR
jgi:hypothetical protein